MSSADPEAPMGVMLGAGVGELVVAASTGFMKRHESDSARVMDCMCATVAGEVESRRGRSLSTNEGVSSFVQGDHSGQLQPPVDLDLECSTILPGQ